MIKRIIEGEWGISHGVITALAGVITWYTVAWVHAAPLVVVGMAYYWVQREAKARRTWDISTWYLDSQLDAIVPSMVAVVFLLTIYL